jgi:hypothetical protein
MDRKVLSILSVLVLSCALAAQTSSQSSSSSSQTSNPDQTQTTPSTPSTPSGQMGTQSDQASSTSAGQAGTHTITGCLSGPNQEGAYVLKSAAGREVEVGGSSDLSANVGKQVSLTGSWAKSGSDIGERESKDTSDTSASSSTTGGGHKEKGERHFQVSSVQKIADTCETSGSSTPK